MSQQAAAAPTPTSAPTSAPTPTPAPTGAPTPTPAPTSAPAPNDNGSPTPTPAPSGAYRPEGIADHLLGANDKETIDKLTAAYTGARTELGKGFKAPDTLDGYVLNIPDEFKGKILQPGADGKDPVFEAMKPVFQKNGISAEGANDLVIELYKVAAAQQQKAQEAAANDPQAADMSFKQLGGPDKAKPLQDASKAWINGLAERLKLDAGDVQELQYLTMHSQGLKVLNKLRGLTSEKPIPADFNGDVNKPVTQADIDAAQSTQAYLDNDPAAHAAARELIRKKQIQEGKLKA